MKGVVLMSPEGQYAYPTKNSGFSQEYNEVSYTKDINGATIWPPTAKYSNIGKSYERALKDGCIPVQAYDVRRVYLGEPK